MSVEIKEITCPVCGDHVFFDEYIDKKMYLCAHQLPDEKIGNITLRSKCCHCLIYCNKCEKILDQSEFGKHGDVYECKNCGTVNWPYTDYRREQDGIISTLKQIKNKNASRLSEIEKRIF